MEIAALGLRVDANGVESAAKSLENLTTQGAKAEKTLEGVERTASKAQKSLEGLGQAGSGAGQAVTKVGDGAAAAQGVAVQSLDKITMSAKATEAALRGVPAQFTDIVVSLQGGMNPMTVFLQQGGQLKDMFGGAGAAAKALGGYVLGLVNPFTTAAAAAAAVGAAYYYGSKEQDAFIKSIVLTGNASGVTTGQLREYARQIDSVIGTQSQAAAGLAAFTAAGVQGGDELRRYTQTAIEWERATGQAVEKTAAQFSSLQKDPLASVLKLNDGTNFLTVSVYEQIKALEEQGKKTEAAEAAMSALDATMRERAKAIEASLGYLERAWRGITGAAKGAWDAMLNVGRQADLNDQLQEVEKKLQTALTSQAWGETAGGAATGRVTEAYKKKVQESIDALTAQKWALTEKMNAESMAAAVTADATRQLQNRIDFDKKWAKALEGEKSLTEKLTAARNEAVAAGKSDADIKTVLAFVTEEHNKGLKKAKDGTKAHNKELSDQAKVYAELAGVSSTYYAELARGQKQLAKGNLTQAQYVKYVEDLIKKQPFAIALAKEEEKAAKALQKAIDDDINAFEKLGQQRESSLKSLQDLVRKMQQEEEAHALAASAKISLAEATERLTIARLQEHLAMARMGGESQSTIDALERELEVRQKLLGAIQTKDVREANKKATEDAAKDWEKVSQTISRTLSDYIMAGGKDAATYLKRLFATLVLEPTVQTAVGAIMGMKDPATGKGGIDLGGSLTDWSNWGGKGSDWLFDQGVGMSFKGFEGLGSSMQSLGVTVGRLDAALKTMPGMSGGIGSAAGYLGSIYALTQGQYGTGLGSAIGTWALPGIGTMIGGALGSLVDGLFGGDSIPRYAATAEYRGGVTSKGWTPDGQWNDALYPTVNGLAGAIGSALDATAKTFGQTAGYELFASFSKDAESNMVFGALNITGPDGKSLVDWSQYNKDWGGRFFSDGEAGEKEFMAAITADVKTAFQAMDIPTWSKQLVGAAEDINGINAALQQIGATKAMFDSWGKSMVMFKDITGELQTQLLNGFGGPDGLSAGVGAFYEGFYTEQERMTILAGNLRESLSGLDLSLDPAMGETAKAQFKSAVEAAMAAGQGELAAKLLAMSQSFVTAADYAQKATDSLRSSLIGLEGKFAGGGFSRQYHAEDLASQVQGMLSGVGIQKDAGVLAQTLLSATAADVESYFREIWNVLPTDEARQKLVNVAGSMLDLAAAADAAAKAVASEREGLEQRWLQAIGDTTEMRRRELEALDPSNRALLEMIYGLEDAKQSMADLTAASQQAAQKAAAAWQGWGTAAGLSAQYLGDTSGLEARRAILGAQISASTDPADRLSKLQELISIEQAIGQAQQASRKTELDAINTRQSALQKEISAAQQLLSAAQSLGDYAHSLQFGATSGLSDADRLAALSGEYNLLIGKARGGDADALKQLQGVSGDYLSLAQTLAVSGSDYSVLSGRMAAEMEALAKGRELFAQSQVTGYEAQIAQLTQQSDLLSAQVELTDSTKSLIAKSMLDQAEVWDRENTQALTLQELQQRATDSLALMPDGIARALRPALDSNTSYLASSIGSTVVNALNSLAEMLGMDGSHATGLSYVPFDGYRAELHRGERVLTAEENRMFSAPRSFVMQGGQGVSGLVAELMTEVRALRTQVAALQRPMEQTAAATTQHAEQFDNATAGGNGMAVSIMEQAAPLQVKEVA
ncbi:phage tail length tape measure family protein [Comamonas sp. Y6]|uniref:Phage tail length tape measure family protein n=1 Tax=Comamonas resistens TaxID=3046670 RepID=A0ABY8SVV8_9BURK|nr:phage tail length tape measure family protein [Comamonas resistens]MDL5036858.1 phage tail length tape measure family protein [Comamonas resistens]WHS67168.1 phage tail length tape measure family protein [Comamonas resistens]